METSLKTGFAQIFSRCPKNLSCLKFGGGCSPPRPPGPYAYGLVRRTLKIAFEGFEKLQLVTLFKPAGYFNF